MSCTNARVAREFFARFASRSTHAQ